MGRSIDLRDLWCIGFFVHWSDDSIFTFPIFNSICVRVNSVVTITRVIKRAIPLQPRASERAARWCHHGHAIHLSYQHRFLCNIYPEWYNLLNQYWMSLLFIVIFLSIAVYRSKPESNWIELPTVTPSGHHSRSLTVSLYCIMSTK